MDLDDIMMSSGKLPCKFTRSVRDLGYLDPSNSRSNDIAAGATIDLPVWLARPLHGKKLVLVEYTKPYKANYRAILDADASVVDLNKSCPFFYKFGLSLLDFDHEDRLALGRVLVTTFVTRLANVMFDVSRHQVLNNMTRGDIGRKVKSFDLTEQRLFKLGQSSLSKYNQWCVGKSKKLETSQLVLRHRKRKMLT